jgi:hypothetical protein
MVRKSKALCDAKGTLLSTGTSTTDKKIIPPIQLIAATTWNQTSRTIITAVRNMNDQVHARCLDPQSPPHMTFPCPVNVRTKLVARLEGSTSLAHPARIGIPSS